VGAALFAGFVCLQFNAFIATTAFFFFLTPLLAIAPASNTQVTGRRTGLAVASPIASCLAVFAILLLAADVRMAGVRKTLETGNVVEAATAYESARRWDPRRGASDLYYSRNIAAIMRRQEGLLFRVKAWQEGVQAGIRATRTAEDRQNAFYHLASLYAQVDNAKDAEKSLRGAIAAAPNWFKPHWTLAQLLHAVKRDAEAIAEAEAAVERDGGKHPEVKATLQALRPR
jgi:tetratricopeptide (TPR) repeat protein